MTRDLPNLTKDAIEELLRLQDGRDEAEGNAEIAKREFELRSLELSKYYLKTISGLGLRGASRYAACLECGLIRPRAEETCKCEGKKSNG
jgi:hypothetical protein